MAVFCLGLLTGAFIGAFATGLDIQRNYKCIKRRKGVRK